MPHVEQDKSLPDAIIVDIDGTVAKMNGRSPYDYSRVSEDLPNEPVVELVGDLSGENIIIYVSGRPYSCYEDTKKWIEENVSNQSGAEIMLFMRNDGDKRPDDVVKEEIFREKILPKYYVRFVLDDRDKVVKMWRSLGLTCLQVAEGNF